MRFTAGTLAGFIAGFCVACYLTAKEETKRKVAQRRSTTPGAFRAFNPGEFLR